ncbi:hypothetical protein JK635_02325 [Neobacillus sp. YIM B02564]|uniref:Uncharacterized protein n=1 Tax=Neobacillus paridis TaxID=2803862 RepID=A0ABS1TID2_9BACI|nr:hypothetical protein [Neobacillus paridis]MBL4951076.1 hypothetical protein [Neobacillus paridis]
MKVQDNRNSKVEVGDMIVTNKNKRYLIAYEEDSKHSYLQIDVETFDIINGYMSDDFKNFKIGYQLYEGESIVEIIKSENLTLNIIN